MYKEIKLSRSLVLIADLEEYSSRFINYLDIKETSKKTYRRAFKQFFSFVSNKAGIQPNSSDVLEYKNYLKELELSTHIITAYSVIICMFFAWIKKNIRETRERVFPNMARNIKKMKLPKGSRKIHLDEIMDQDTLAVINIFVKTGLRTTELHNANIRDVSQIVKMII